MQLPSQTPSNSSSSSSGRSKSRAASCQGAPLGTAPGCLGSCMIGSISATSQLARLASPLPTWPLLWSLHHLALCLSLFLSIEPVSASRTACFGQPPLRNPTHYKGSSLAIKCLDNKGIPGLLITPPFLSRQSRAASRFPWDCIPLSQPQARHAAQNDLATKLRRNGELLLSDPVSFPTCYSLVHCLLGVLSACTVLTMWALLAQCVFIPLYDGLYRHKNNHYRSGYHFTVSI